MSIAIIIPARYESTRFPGKPLAKIAGKTMLQRVYELAQSVVQNIPIQIIIATDDLRIAEHARALQASVIMTPVECSTGTDRVHAAVVQMSTRPEFIINLQGDSPLTPPWFLQALIAAYQANVSFDAITPVVQLTWQALDCLRVQKKNTPFSGTTALLKADGTAIWFSKNILPALRKEDRSQPISPIFQHIGLYGYRYAMLEQYVNLPQTPYEQCEGLEQLRIIEHGYTLHCVKVDYRGRAAATGIDSPEDVVHAEHLLAEYGEHTI